MNLLKDLRMRWWREQYEPSYLGVFINPFFIARRGLLHGLRPLLSNLSGEVLDVGCGCQPYRKFVPTSHYVGLDIDNEFTRKVGIADVFYSGGSFPLADKSFDGVLCSQVLEHVFAPEPFLREIHRILRPDGILVLTVPFIWDEHEQPQDFARYSSFGLRALLERNGFEIEVQKKSGADVSALAQLNAAWIFKVVATKSKWLNLLTQLILIAPVTLMGLILGAIFPANADVYLDNVVLAKKRGGA